MIPSLSALECKHLLPQKESICAVAVTFFPDTDFSARISRILPQVAHLVIVDNGSGLSNTDVFERALASNTDVNIIRNASNLGVAKALNEGIQWAIENGYTWVLLLDQDTEPADDMVSTLIKVYEEFPQSEKLAIIGCNPFPISPPGAGRWKAAKVVITSGTLLSLRAAVEIGPFREEFFIDCVDFEFCLRAARMGFSIIEVQAPVMQHVIGNPRKVSLQWIARMTPNHRPWRSYYTTRNLVVMVREYLWKEPSWVCHTVWRRTKEVILMILFEPAKLQKIKYIALGLFDGITGNFSRHVISA